MAAHLLPHYEKLQALLVNPKLPPADLPRVQEALERYRDWIHRLNEILLTPCELTVARMVKELSSYKDYIDLILIFNSPNDFLYRQKGQLKLDNTIIEEFLPWLMRDQVVQGIPPGCRIGPTTCFSSVYFDSRIDLATESTGLKIRAKDQDFSVSRPVYIKTSHTPDYQNSAEELTFISYVAAEIKTNLDKTMFQEASATAHDVKLSVKGSKYYLLCEWLDMTPLSTSATAIDEILLLRGAKRIASDKRKNFATPAGRNQSRAFFQEYLASHPFRADVFERFVEHVKKLVSPTDPIENEVLRHGFF